MHVPPGGRTGQPGHARSAGRPGNSATGQPGHARSAGRPGNLTARAIWRLGQSGHTRSRRPGNPPGNLAMHVRAARRMKRCGVTGLTQSPTSPKLHVHARICIDLCAFCRVREHSIARWTNSIASTRQPESCMARFQRFPLANLPGRVPAVPGRVPAAEFPPPSSRQWS